MPKTLLFPAVISLLPFAGVPLSAQENERAVVLGRDFQETRLLSPGLTDVWKLDVHKDEMLWCVVDSNAFDPVLELVDSDGTVLGQNDGAGTRSELWLRMPAKGPVQFRVQPYQGSGGGHYSFWLHRFRTEALDTDSEATRTFGREQWWNYRVALQQGDVLVPTVTGEGRLSGVLDAQRNAVPAMLGGYRAPHTGDYFVRVEGSKDRRFHIGTQLARRRALGSERTADDALPPFGFDIWRVPVRAGSAFVLDLRMPDTQLAVDLVDPTPTDAGPCFVMPGHHDKGGRLHRYYFARRDCELELRLRNQGGRAATYRAAFTLPERDFDADTPASDRLAIGAGAIHRLHLTGGQLLHLSLHSDAFDGRLDLWNPDGAVIAHADDSGPLDRDPSHTFLVDRSGDYRVLVHCAGAAGSGDYTLQAERLAVPELQPGTPITLHLDAKGTRYAHLQLQAGQEVWLSVRSSTFDAGLTVLDPAGNASFRCGGGGCGDDVLVAYRASHTGRHTLLVHSRSGAGDCELRALLP